MEQKKKSFAIATLRRASYRWPGRYLSEKRSKVGRNQYQCECCKGIFPKKETQMDHVIPVVPIEGFASGLNPDFNDYIDRLFCDESGFQRLCLTCHDIKTEKENGGRKAKRKRSIKKKVDTDDII